jgi:hypothetical protein
LFCFDFIFLFFCLVSLCFETGSLREAQASLGLLILLPWPPEYWDYRAMLPHPAFLSFFLWYWGLNS